MTNGTKQRRQAPATKAGTSVVVCRPHSVNAEWSERIDQAGIAMSLVVAGGIVFSLFAEAEASSWLTIIGGVFVLLAFLVRHFVNKFDKSNGDYVALLEEQRDNAVKERDAAKQKLELAMDRLRTHGEDSGIIS